MTRRCTTTKVPLDQIRQQLTESEPMVRCPLCAPLCATAPKDDLECPVCHDVGIIPVHILT